MKTKKQERVIPSHRIELKQKPPTTNQFADKRNSMETQAKMIDQIQNLNTPITQLSTEIKYTQGNIHYRRGVNQYGAYWGDQTVGIETTAFLDPRDPKTGSRTAAGVGIYQHGQYPRLVQGHLLNANLGGQAIPQNLFPITTEMNRAHSTQVEDHVKAKFLELYAQRNTPGWDHRRLYYNVQVNNPNLALITPATLRATTFVVDAHLTDNNDPNGNGGEIADLAQGSVHMAIQTPADLNEQLATAGFAPTQHPSHQIGNIINALPNGQNLYQINDGGGHPVPGITVQM